MNTRLRTGKGVSGAVRYVMGEGRDPESGQLKELGLGAQSRVDWFGGTGFDFPITSQADVDLGRRVMEFDAIHQGPKRRPCEQDCVHIMLAWARGETPSRADMEAAAHGALKSLKMDNAKAVFVAHNDEDYAHLHIIASRLNPETGLTFDLKASHRRLSRFAETHERENGGIINLARADANALRDAIAAGDAGAVLDAMVKQRATFTTNQLESALGKEMKNELGRAMFGNEILQHPRIVALSDTPGGPLTRYSTKEAIEAERYALAAAARLDTNNSFQVDPANARAIMQQPQFTGATDEQRNAFYRITGAAGIALVDGQAGTGKTDYTITAARVAYEAEGYRVIALAPTNKVANDLGQKQFRHTNTVHAELFALSAGREKWDSKTVAIVDEAAMLDTKLTAVLLSRAAEAGAKIVLVGDDRQLTSIDRGGMFGVLKDRHGAAEITEVKRQNKTDQRRASEQMARGDFDSALRTYNAAGAIHWTRTQPEARASLVKQWTKDSAAEPNKSRFVFAYTNADVDTLNAAIRGVRRDRGELGASETKFDTKHGRMAFAEKDRIQFTGTDKKVGIVNGDAGTIQKIDGDQMTVQLDGKKTASVTFDTSQFRDFRHGYAGTIYRGQGSTLDQTYLYHSEHWRKAGSYVALTRHRDSANIFVATNTLNPRNQAEPWMLAKGGADKLSREHHESAKSSYAKWAEGKPDLAARYDFANYVQYVQKKWADDPQRRESSDEIRQLARQMARTEERRAASAFQTIESQEPLRPRTADELTELFAPKGPQPFGADQIQRQQDERERPKLGKIAANIRMAWTETKGAEEFGEALATHGMSLARVTAEDVRAHDRGRALKEAVGSWPGRTIAKDDLVVVNGWGSIYQLDPRLTGSGQRQIADRLAGFDGASMLSVADTRDALRDASRAAWAVQRDKERPMSKIEQTIAEALTTTMTGTDFAAALDDKRLTIARVSETDRGAIAALRDADETARLLDKEMSGLSLPKKLNAGDLVAVTPRGHVFALNPNRLDCEDIEQRLLDTQRRLPSVVEARAKPEQKRAETSKLWAKRRADALDRRISHAEKQRFRAKVRTTVRYAKRLIFATGDAFTPKKAASPLTGAARIIIGAFELIANMFAPPPPLTPQQRELKHRGNKKIAAAIATEDRIEQNLRFVIDEDQRGHQQRGAAEPGHQADRQTQEEHQRERHGPRLRR